MRKPLLDLICCPVCHSGQFDLAIDQETSSEIRQGTVTCKNCQRAYPVNDGILDLLVDPSQEILNEQAGWTQLEKYVVNTDEVMLSLPDGIGEHKAAWQCQAENFHYLWSEVKFTAGEKVLDLGAGRCWATRYFARQGCNAVGLDVLLTRYVGLKTADVFMEKEGVYFDRICGDMHQIPLGKNTFDVVFMAATLHHSDDIQATLRQVHEVLKPGGRLILVNEPVVGMFDSKAVKGPEVDHGINEHVYRYLEYRRALRKLKMDYRLYPFIGSYNRVINKLNHLVVRTFPRQLMPQRIWRPFLVTQLLVEGGILNLIATKRSNT
jgi:uncharacterized protein YbaR (Trm112 family)/ubiquinone/menaquinone biosynthesis C-methylase UbiE